MLNGDVLSAEAGSPRSRAGGRPRALSSRARGCAGPPAAPRTRGRSGRCRGDPGRDRSGRCRSAGARRGSARRPDRSATRRRAARRACRGCSGRQRRWHLNLASRPGHVPDSRKAVLASSSGSSIGSRSGFEGPHCTGSPSTAARRMASHEDALLTSNDRKSRLSVAYVQAVAASVGYVATDPSRGRRARRRFGWSARTTTTFDCPGRCRPSSWCSKCRTKRRTGSRAAPTSWHCAGVPGGFRSPATRTWNRRPAPYVCAMTSGSCRTRCAR